MPDLTQFGAAGAIVIVVWFFLKFTREESVRREVTYDKLSAAIEKTAVAAQENTMATRVNTQTTNEMRLFMLRLNGSLKHTVEEKQQLKAQDEENA
jgi:hypothetical protein